MTDNPLKPLLSVPHVAQLLGRGTQTIRNWTDEFGSYLSPNANINERSNGRHRFYEREDVAKLMMVKEWRELKYRPEEIAMALQDEANWHKYLHHIDDQSLSLQLVDSDNKRLEIDLALAEKELNSQRAELQRLREMVEASAVAREENIRLNTLVQGLQQQVNAAQNEITRAAATYFQILQNKDAQFQQLLQSRDGQFQQAQIYIRKLQEDISNNREALGRASAIEEQLREVQQNYHQYYQLAEEELRHLREQVAILNAELRHRTGEDSSSAPTDSSIKP